MLTFVKNNMLSMYLYVKKNKVAYEDQGCVSMNP